MMAWTVKGGYSRGRQWAVNGMGDDYMFVTWYELSLGIR
jgi:hypothetical protein